MQECQVRTTEGRIQTLESTFLSDFSARIKGAVLSPSDPDYEEVRKVWNAMIDRKPGLIVQCVSSDDVVTAVRMAKQQDLLVSIRGAGHNIAGKSIHDGAMLIDLSRMTDVSVDPESRIATASPGATLGDVDAATQAHGLAVPTGINSTTGVGGLTLGGGFGWISRKHGLTLDNLVAAEVVTAEGEKVRCTARDHSDLFWATRGGGGNFGVVTSFEFSAHPVGPEVLSGPIVFPAEQGMQILEGYREFCATCPDELTVWAVMRGAPPLPFLDESIHGTDVVILATLYNGPMADGEKAVAPLRDLGDPVGDAIGPHPFAGFQQAFDPLLTPGARNYWKSHNFTELSSPLLKTLLEYARNLPSDQSEIFVAQLGAAINRVAPDATAYPHRDVEFVMNVHTRWDDASQDEECIAWARDFYDATESFATGGVYVNFISDGEDRVDGAYGANFAKLSEVKAKYDPDNFFRLNQNITPKR